MKRLIFILLQATLSALPVICFSQAFEGLYDVDSTLNKAWDIFIKPDSSYFMIGFAQDPQGPLHLSDMNITTNGSQIVDQHTFGLGTAPFTYLGDEGSAKQLPNGGYLFPITIQQQDRSWAGLAKLDAPGDTVFMRTYTDTSVFFDGMDVCAVMQNGDYLVGGIHATDTPSYYPAGLIRTDTNGNLLWEHTYQKYANQFAKINSIDTLTNDRILVGASSNFDYATSLGVFNYANPWFMILDSAGNILKDTVFNGTLYVGGGAIYKDINGGYYHRGEFSEPVVAAPPWGAFLPFYLAHLDTNFNVTWVTTFPYSAYFGDRIPVVVRQTQDSGYIIAGDIQVPYIGWYRAWGAKVDKHGTLLWQHTYISDSDADSYFNDVRQRPDGSYIFCGYAHSDTLPSWHVFYDAWLVSVDSNGCLQPGCGPDTTDSSLVVPIIPAQGEVMVWPNPAQNEITIEVSLSSGESRREVSIYDMLGRSVYTGEMKSAKQTIDISKLTDGNYILQIIGSDGTRSIQKIVIEK